jgi:hypothetical protein
MKIWFNIDFNKLVNDLFAKLTAGSEMVPLVKCIFELFYRVQETALYRMQHNGETIYLEKVLNDFFTVPGYDPTDHDGTKQIYIEDALVSEKIYIHQNAEEESVFIEDDGDDSEDDLFLDSESEGNDSFGFIIFIPDTIPFNEAVVRSVVNNYRYIGTYFTIQTYTL